MTIIEFFERESHVENIISTLLCAPDKVIFLGDSKKKMDRLSQHYKEIAASRGINVEFDPRSINRNDLMSIASTIEEVVEEVLENDDECIIDLSGGDDLSLVAIGTVYAENADRIKLHRFNISNSTMTDCDSDGVLCNSSPIELTVDELITINGGRVVYSHEKENGTYDWDFNDDFVDDLFVMWSFCKENPTLWNVQISILDKLQEIYLDPDCLSVYINYEEAKKVLNSRGEKFDFKTDIYKKLNALGVISDLRYDSESISFEFKNKQVMKCLTKAGQVLELIVAFRAAELVDEDGETVYTDVKTGVYIDWDGEIHPDYEPDVENEIDVILMKGLVPVFISCKNGRVSKDELYKFSVVAEKFGGKYVRKVLAVSDLNKAGEEEAYIRARCDAMDIRIFDDINKITEEKFLSELEKIWCPN